MIDAEICPLGAGARVAAAVLAETGRRGPTAVLRWLAVAATLVIAAGLGGLRRDHPLAGDRQAATSSCLDPLTFGATGVDQ